MMKLIFLSLVLIASISPALRKKADIYVDDAFLAQHKADQVKEIHFDSFLNHGAVRVVTITDAQISIDLIKKGKRQRIIQGKRTSAQAYTPIDKLTLEKVNEVFKAADDKYSLFYNNCFLFADKILNKLVLKKDPKEQIQIGYNYMIDFVNRIPEAFKKHSPLFSESFTGASKPAAQNPKPQEQEKLHPAAQDSKPQDEEKSFLQMITGFFIGENTG